MGKRILIGSMLVLTLLLLMPSIPAIQTKTIEDRTNGDKTYSSLLDNQFFIIGIMYTDSRVGTFAIHLWWSSIAVFGKSADSDWQFYGPNKLTFNCRYNIPDSEFIGYVGIGGSIFSGPPFFICGIVEPI